MNASGLKKTIYITATSLLMIACSQAPTESLPIAETVTSEEINHNILNTEKWKDYNYNDNTILFFYCGDTSEVSINTTRAAIASYCKKLSDLNYIEFYTDEYNSLAALNDTMFFDMNELFKEDGFLLLKNGDYEIINLQTDSDEAKIKINNFFNLYVF